jgi:hypothetical protein
MQMATNAIKRVEKNNDCTYEVGPVYVGRLPIKGTLHNLCEFPAL